MKYIVVGTSHSGYEVIQTLLKEDENADIQVLKVQINRPFYLVVFKVILKTSHLH